MLCRQCGFDNDPGDVRCVRCDYDLTHQDDPIDIPRAEAQDTPHAPPGPVVLPVSEVSRDGDGKGSRRSVWISLGLLIVLIGAIVAVEVFKGDFRRLYATSGNGGGVGVANGASAAARTPRPRATATPASPTPPVTPGVVAVKTVTPKPTLPADMEVVIAAVDDALFHKEGCPSVEGTAGALVTVGDAVKLGKERCMLCLPE